MTSPQFRFSALTVLFLWISAGNVSSAEPAVPGYTPSMRLNVQDAGIILRHGDGPNQCDIHGEREPTLIVENGKYHLFYDGGVRMAGSPAWRRARI